MGPHHRPVGSEPTRARRESGEHRPQIIGVDLARKPESFRSRAEPAARGFARTGVVVVEGLGDARELVGLLADAKLGDAQHSARMRNLAPGVTPEVTPDRPEISCTPSR
jgi:hypothetical protein